MEPKSCLADVVDDEEKRVSENEIELYCTECIKKILPWKLTRSGTHSFAFHKNLAEFIECAKQQQCKLCAYLCNLYGVSYLEDLLLELSGDQDVTVSILHSTRAEWDDHLAPDGVMRYVVMGFCVDDPADKNVVLEKREFSVCTGAARALLRAIWSSNKLIDLDARCETIREWINECDMHHPRCKEKLNPDSGLAARILDVHRSSQGEFVLKLVSTKRVDLRKEKYFVLSHVWGVIDIPCKTRRSNINRYFKKGVPFDELPLTFKDAVKITAAVGLRYIWIDSLCIIQDKEEDWQREAAKMAAIFRFATLTISATSAHNSLGGCNLSPTTELATQFSSGLEGYLDFAIRGPEYDNSMLTLQTQMCESVLNTRAWVFQEQMLSPRTLHATHSQFVWQCPTHIESEDGIHYEDHRRDRNVIWPKFDRYYDRVRPSADGKDFAPHPYKLSQDWWFWVSGYMKRTLKVGSDQYAAMAGVVRLYQELTNNEPIVGLWKRDLVLHLAWTVSRDDLYNKVALLDYGTRRPSWTWMSYPHGSVGVQGPWLEWEALTGGSRPYDVGIVYEALHLGTDVSWSGEALTSEPSGTITIRGICAPHPRPKLHGYGFRQRQLHLDPDLPESIQAREAFDTIALVAYVKTGGLTISPPSLMTFYLVIEPIGLPENNSYIRIGTFQVSRELRAITQVEYEPQGTWKDIILV